MILSFSEFFLERSFVYRENIPLSGIFSTRVTSYKWFNVSLSEIGAGKKETFLSESGKTAKRRSTPHGARMGARRGQEYRLTSRQTN